MRKQTVKLKNMLKVSEVSVVFVVAINLQFLLHKVTRGKKIIQKRKRKKNHCSSRSNAAWCDLNSKGDTQNLQDLSHNPKSKFQKQNVFTPK